MKYITPVRPDAAQGLVADVYQQIKRDFGAIVDPFVVHSIAPGLLAAVWGACRESEVVGTVPREIKETIAVTISKTNQVPYCVDAHVVMLHALKAHHVAQALTHGRTEQLSDGTRKIYDWSRTTGQSEGLRPRFSDSEAAELIGTAVFFHYMNRVATVLLDDTPLPSARWWLKGALTRIAGWYFSFAARRPKMPGASLAFLPDAELPEDLAWASANKSLAGAWARFAREIERQGQSALPAEIRTFAGECLQRWQGDISQDSASVESSIQRLDPDQRNGGKLVLLTAIAPHLVDDAVIRAFAEPGRDQKKILGAVCWTSFTVARQIGSRLHCRMPLEAIVQSADGVAH
jgi:AhpD family alkylhydroperoxidase